MTIVQSHCICISLNFILSMTTDAQTHMCANINSSHSISVSQCLFIIYYPLTAQAFVPKKVRSARHYQQYCARRILRSQDTFPINTRIYNNPCTILILGNNIYIFLFVLKIRTRRCIYCRGNDFFQRVIEAKRASTTL